MPPEIYSKLWQSIDEMSVKLLSISRDVEELKLHLGIRHRNVSDDLRAKRSALAKKLWPARKKKLEARRLAKRQEETQKAS
jgi:hypothetical protein